MEEDIDFQIRFFEDLVRDDPEFIDALLPLADAYTRKGWFEKGLRLDEKLAGMLPRDANVFYNLSCSHALLNQEAEALAALRQALELGYDDLSWMGQDPDLSALRKSEGYRRLVGEYFPPAAPGGAPQ